MSMVHRLGAVLLLAALLIPAPAPAAEEVRVGVSIPAAVAFVPLQVGIERGIFAKHGLDIKRSDLGGAARAHQALAANSLDIVVAGGPDLSLVAKGQHARAVGVITVAPRQTTLIVRNDSAMKAPAELKGKRVGISTAGGLSEWVVRQLSRQLGFGPAGNGRVYSINFTASDGKGGECSGSVTVSGPIPMAQVPQGWCAVIAVCLMKASISASVFTFPPGETSSPR